MARVGQHLVKSYIESHEARRLLRSNFYGVESSGRFAVVPQTDRKASAQRMHNERRFRSVGCELSLILGFG